MALVTPILIEKLGGYLFIIFGALCAVVRNNNLAIFIIPNIFIVWSILRNLGKRD